MRGLQFSGLAPESPKIHGCPKGFLGIDENERNFNDFAPELATPSPTLHRRGKQQLTEQLVCRLMPSIAVLIGRVRMG
jgi:hypothetical protein